VRASEFVSAFADPSTGSERSPATLQRPFSVPQGTSATNGLCDSRSSEIVKGRTMIYFKSLQPLSLDRGPQLRYEAGVERLAVHSRRSRQQRRRRLALDIAFELLRRGRHHARYQTASALNRQEGCIVDLVVKASNRKLIASRRVLPPVERPAAAPCRRVQLPRPSARQR